MDKHLTVLIALMALTFGVNACTQEQSALNKPPGTYEKTVRSTDEYGTTTTRKTSTDVDVDEYGNKTAVVKSKTTKDPKGMFNKTTTSQSKEVIEEKY